MKGLYVHIPFCESICHYCDFVKRVPSNQENVDLYLDALIKEIELYKNHFDTIKTIYIGGGTPSMLTVKQLKKVFEALKDIHPIEYSIEVNPESYSKEKGLLMKAYGINRVSLGVQTFNQELLHYLNRKHTNQQVYDVVNHLKLCGIERISVDLIFAIPGQTIEDLDNDLKHIQKLDITHVSSYSLILEEKTYFYHQYLKGNFEQMDQDLEATMYEKVIKDLENFGFKQYEISNFSKYNHESLHNKIYWTLDDYIGVGLGAHGFVEGYRTYNERSMPLYFDHFQKEKTYQTKDMLIQDALIFGLRNTKGIKIDNIEKQFDINIFERYPKLKEKMDYGLLKIEKGYLKLTKKGTLLGNQVFMVFI
jgi:oxygen-independent coproporphyrinogen-3 oxidase